MDLEERKRLAEWERNQPQFRNFGTCGRCDRSWGGTKGHSTQFSETGGCFPLCEECWSELTPAERLPFYAALRDEWIRQCYAYPRKDWSLEDMRKHDAEIQEEWPLIEAAVLEGK